MITEAFDVVAAPRLLAYRLHRTCPACGQTALLRHRLWHWVIRMPDRYFDVRFCPGGKEPTSTEAVQSVIGVQMAEIRHDCAGVHEPHLHIRCRNCAWAAITEVCGHDQGEPVRA